MPTERSFRQRVLAGELLVGTFLVLDSPLGAEMVARTGLDWVLVDLEHGASTEATLLPRLTTGGTDATFFRERGTIAYGFGLLSRAVTFADFASRFHGHDERIDVESLRLTTACWLYLCRDVLG